MGKRDDQDWRKKREREDEAEAEHLTRSLKKAGVPQGTGGPPVSKLEDLIEKIPPLIEQVNQLYNMYLSGVEKRPPIERRQYLDQCIAQLGAFPKPTQVAQFKATTLLQTYQTHRDRWDRLLRAKEK